MALFSVARFMRRKDPEEEEKRKSKKITVRTSSSRSHSKKRSSRASNESRTKSGRPSSDSRKKSTRSLLSGKKKKANSASRLRISAIPPTSGKYPTPPNSAVKVIKRVPITDDSGKSKSKGSPRPPSAPVFVSQSNVTPRRNKRYSQSERSIREARRRSSRRISLLVAKLEEEKEREKNKEKNRVISLDSSDIKLRSSFRESALTKLQEVIDESNDTPWERIRLMSSPFPRYRHIASTYATADNRMFVMGGLHGQLVYGDTWCLQANEDCTDFTTRVIDLSISTPPPRVGHAATLCGNALVVFGGDTHKLTADGLLDDDLYLFNVDSHKWTVPKPIGTRPLGRYGHQISVIATSTRHAKLYLFGGQLDDNYFNDLAMYDLADFRNPHSRWEFFRPKGINPPPLTNHTMVSYDYKLWVFGGSSRGELMNELYVYFPEENEWKHIETTGQKPNPMQEHSATIFHNLMCVFGGKTEDDEYQNDFYFLNLQTLKWYKLPSFEGYEPLPRSGHSITLMQNRKLLIVGGDKNDFLSGDAKTSELTEVDQGHGVAVYTLDLSNLNDYCPGVFSVDKPVNLAPSTVRPISTVSVPTTSPVKEPEILTPYLKHVRQLNRLLSTSTRESSLSRPSSGRKTYTNNDLLETYEEKQDDNKNQEEQKMVDSPNISIESDPHSALNSDISGNSGNSEHDSVFEDSMSLGNVQRIADQNSEEYIVESKDTKNPFVTTNPYENFPSNVIQINQHIEDESELAENGIQDIIHVPEATIEQLKADLNELKAIEKANDASANDRIAQLQFQITHIKATQVDSPDRAGQIRELNERCDALEREKRSLRDKIQKLNLLLEKSSSTTDSAKNEYLTQVDKLSERSKSLKQNKEVMNDYLKSLRSVSDFTDDSHSEIFHEALEEHDDSEQLQRITNSNETLKKADDQDDSKFETKKMTSTEGAYEIPETPVLGSGNYSIASNHEDSPAGTTSVPESPATPRRSPDRKRKKRNSVRRRTRIVLSQKHKEVMDEITKQLDILTQDSSELAVDVLDEMYYDISNNPRENCEDLLSSTRTDEVVI